jgi:hypothetical protein
VIEHTREAFVDRPTTPSARIVGAVLLCTSSSDRRREQVQFHTTNGSSFHAAPGRRGTSTWGKTDPALAQRLGGGSHRERIRRHERAAITLGDSDLLKGRMSYARSGLLDPEQGQYPSPACTRLKHNSFPASARFASLQTHSELVWVKALILRNSII